jgi:hypothetical protein
MPTSTTEHRPAVRRGRMATAVALVVLGQTLAASGRNGTIVPWNLTGLGSGRDAIARACALTGGGARSGYLGPPRPGSALRRLVLRLIGSPATTTVSTFASTEPVVAEHC